MIEEKEIDDKEKKTKEPIKPVLIVPGIDSEHHSVIETTTQEDAELLKTALQNPHGVDVWGPKDKKKICPCDPEKPYDKSICKKIDKLFEKRKEKKEKRRKNEI